MYVYVILPAITVLLGIAGAFLRAYEIANAFDRATGLVEIGHPSTALLICLSVAVAAILIFALVRARVERGSVGGYEEAFSIGSSGYAVIAVCGCFLLIISAACGAYEILISEARLLPVLPDIALHMLALISAACLISLVAGNYRRKQGKNHGISALMPVFYMCYWLILAYRDKAADPVILDYSYGMLAIISSTLGMYYAAGFAFGRLNPKRAVFFSLFGVYLSTVTLADMHSLSVTLAYMFVIIDLLLNSAVLLRNMSR